MAVCYTDFWAAYAKVLPQKRHNAVGKETGHTNHIERFNNTSVKGFLVWLEKHFHFQKK
jgi:IS1 family transposase